MLIVRDGIDVVPPLYLLLLVSIVVAALFTNLCHTIRVAAGVAITVHVIVTGFATLAEPMIDAVTVGISIYKNILHIYTFLSNKQVFRNLYLDQPINKIDNLKIFTQLTSYS